MAAWPDLLPPFTSYLFVVVIPQCAATRWARVSRLSEFGDMRVANRAIDEAPELQMDQALCIGEVYGLPGHGLHHRPRQHVSWREFHGLAASIANWTDRSAMHG